MLPIVIPFILKVEFNRGDAQAAGLARAGDVSPLVSLSCTRRRIRGEKPVKPEFARPSSLYYDALASLKELTDYEPRQSSSPSSAGRSACRRAKCVERTRSQTNLRRLRHPHATRGAGRLRRRGRSSC